MSLPLLCVKLADVEVGRIQVTIPAKTKSGYQPADRLRYLDDDGVPRDFCIIVGTNESPVQVFQPSMFMGNVPMKIENNDGAPLLEALRNSDNNKDTYAGNKVEVSMRGIGEDAERVAADIERLYEALKRAYYDAHCEKQVWPKDYKLNLDQVAMKVANRTSGDEGFIKCRISERLEVRGEPNRLVSMQDLAEHKISESDCVRVPKLALFMNDKPGEPIADPYKSLAFNDKQGVFILSPLVTQFAGMRYVNLQLCSGVVHKRMKTLGDKRSFGSREEDSAAYHCKRFDPFALAVVGGFGTGGVPDDGDDGGTEQQAKKRQKKA